MTPHLHTAWTVIGNHPGPQGQQAWSQTHLVLTQSTPSWGVQRGAYALPNEGKFSAHLSPAADFQKNLYLVTTSFPFCQADVTFYLLDT